MVDAVVSVFLEKLANVLIEEGRIVIDFQDEFDKMKKQLGLMQSFLKDADRVKRKNQTLRTIMDDLRELIYDAEDILADCLIRSNEEREVKSHFSMCFFPSALLFHYQTGKRLREINQRVIEIKGNMDTFLTSSHVVAQTNSEEYNNEYQRWSSPVFDQTQIVGLVDDVVKIKGWLLEANNGLTSIGIVGMGGLGKTTASQLVFNDRQVDEHFERMMWVSVSQTFTEEEIMRSMLRNLGDASIGDDRGELLKKINQYLTGKRYLIVMDDVWSLRNGWWKRLSDGLPKGNGSSIIITTRNEVVARGMGVVEGRLHRPKLLSMAESWTLFCKIAFAENSGECRNPELEEVGKEIVEKCDGLPLAIKAVAGMMLCKSRSSIEWRRIADNFSEELEENDDSVMASLQLSYDELPSHLKPCFLSFSLYPEDCVIPKEQLTHWWIGEGFIPRRGGRLIVESSEDCFSGLLNRCLVEVVDKSYSGKVGTCKIHDLVRDLVIKMAEKEAFCRLEGASSRHLGFRSKLDKWRLQNNPKLRSLLSTTNVGEVNKIDSAVVKKFYECQYLRVLDLSKSIFETHLKDLLGHIGSLQHITYLSLRNTHPTIQFPLSMENLGNLQILDVSYCHNLKTLPSYITSLHNLTVLDLSHCGSLEYLPKGLGRLTNLQVLVGFRPSRLSQMDGCRLAELRSLTQLKTLELRITTDDEIGYNELNSLSQLQKLQFLTINCFDSCGVDLAMKLDKLSPPQQLDELSLKYFPGELTPSWLNPNSLPSLHYLSISSGNFSHVNPRFWGTENVVWKLEGLMLECLSDLEEEWSQFQLAMPSLQLLSISWCPHLESFPVDDVGFKGDVWRKGVARR